MLYIIYETLNYMERHRWLSVQLASRLTIFVKGNSGNHGKKEG